MNIAILKNQELLHFTKMHFNITLNEIDDDVSFYRNNSKDNHSDEYYSIGILEDNELNIIGTSRLISAQCALEVFLMYLNQNEEAKYQYELQYAEPAISEQSAAIENEVKETAFERKGKITGRKKFYYLFVFGLGFTCLLYTFITQIDRYLKGNFTGLVVNLLLVLAVGFGFVITLKRKKN